VSIEEHVEVVKKIVKPKLFTEEVSSQETLKRRSLKQMKKKRAIKSPVNEVIAAGNSTSAQTTPAASKKRGDKYELEKKMQDHFEKVVAPEVK
jgi:Asp-tRNA(Asn)/Glu-tRNA(Gln) amidotransferase B subunit